MRKKEGLPKIEKLPEISHRKKNSIMRLSKQFDEQIMKNEEQERLNIENKGKWDKLISNTLYRSASSKAFANLE